MSAIIKTKPVQSASASTCGEIVSAAAEAVNETSSLTAKAIPVALEGDRLLAFQSMQLLMRIDRDLTEARAQWNQDWFRRLMHVRPKAVRRLTRRWERLTPTPSIGLGMLRRRYHANLACYLYKTRS
ncbi:MAG: hypothetical protein ACREBG_18515 [Pyrinomonadaceae bacterium]